MLQFAVWTACAAFAAQLAPAQSIDDESFARALVDAPGGAHGDDAADIESWLALVEAQPEHPLAEAALLGIEAQGDNLIDTPGALERIEKLSPAKFGFGARTELARLQGLARARRTALSDPSRDAHPDCLAHFHVLGPLAPLADPFGALAERERLVDPHPRDGFVDAYGKPIGWIDVVRAPSERSLARLDALLKVHGGHALVAVAFDAPHGGPAWIEIDTRDGIAARAIDFASTQRAPWYQVIDNPSYVFSLDGGAPVTVDWLAAPTSAIHREPVVLRDGVNRLVFSTDVSGGTTFSIRVLDASGSPFANLEDAALDAPLGAEVSASAPNSAIESSESHLRSLADRGADTEALLGVLCYADGRVAEGLARVAKACSLAPDRAGLVALRSRLVPQALYLPDSYKKSRSRELAEAALKLDPSRVDVRIELARRLVPEDKEEDAITALKSASADAKDPTEALLELESVYPRLEMDVAAERALEELFVRGRPNAQAYRRAAARLEAASRPTSALEAERRSLEFGELDPSRFTELAHRYEANGLAPDAETSFRAASAIGGSIDELIDLGDFYAHQERWSDADHAYSAAALRLPSWIVPHVRLADLAHAKSDVRSEQSHLERALELEPSNSELARRLAVSKGADLAQLDSDFAAKVHERADRVLADYDSKRFDDSLVRVLDWGDVTVFEDGAYQILTHTILQLRDLKAIEKEGTQRLRGEVLEVCTRKLKDGSRFEPVGTKEGFVMPSLEPGDFVETVTREEHPAPVDGLVDYGRWNFASVDEPFHLTHYSLSVPKALKVELVRRHLDQFANVVERHEESDGERDVYIFEAHDVPRIVPEPGAPPPNWFVPAVEFGRRADPALLAARLRATAIVPTRITPEIEEAAAKAIVGIDGDEARAKALYAFAQKTVDKRQATFASATSTLLLHEGNPTWAFAALLEAAHIDHDVLWSRDASPEADPEPDVAFFDETRWLERSLVVVRPKDGREAWCDPSIKLLPYGKLLANAPRAPAFATGAAKFVATPDVELADRIGRKIDMSIALHADRSADFEVRLEFTGNFGYAQKENFRSASKTQRKSALSKLAGQIVPGFDLASGDMEGLDSDDAPLVFVMKGKVAHLLDDSNGELSCKLPLPALELAAGLTGGEGERKLPYFLAEPIVFEGSVNVVLPPELALVGDGPSGAQPFRNGSFSLTTRRGADLTSFLIRRDLLLPALSLEAKEYPGLVEFCTRVDELERARLRFTKR